MSSAVDLQLPRHLLGRRLDLHQVTSPSEEGGGPEDGKKIALVYHNSAYGKEPIRTLKSSVGASTAYELTDNLPVDHPGQEQKAHLAAGSS